MSGILIHEWIEQTGGAEKVFDAFVDAFPSADLLCLWNDDEGRYGDRAIRESWIARTPLRRSKPLALPFMPAAWTAMRLQDYDWSLISSHLFAHHAGGIRASASGMRKYVYVHSPARYLWTPDLDQRGDKPLVRAVAPALRALDRRRARASGAQFSANSMFVRQRIQDAWGVDADVIYPPVDVKRIQARSSWADVLNEHDQEVLAGLPETFLLGAARFVPYKRLDLVIEAGEHADVPVVLAGSGPHQAALEERAAQARVPVVFLDRPSDALLFALYQRALAYVFPAVEDFGIMPVEAMAAGAPVLVSDLGGATESVVNGLTGVHVNAWTKSEVIGAVSTAAGLRAEDSALRARRFDADTFRTEIRSWVGEVADALPHR